MNLRRYSNLCLCLIVLLGTLQLRADVTGSILGYVRDSSGAVTSERDLNGHSDFHRLYPYGHYGRVGPVQHSCFASRQLPPDRLDDRFRERSH